MPAEWYTVPRIYGGRGLSWRRRIYLEWTWRRHGTAGLDRIISRRTERFVAAFVEIGKAAERAAAEATKAFEALAVTLERAKDADRR